MTHWSSTKSYKKWKKHINNYRSTNKNKNKKNLNDLCNVKGFCKGTRNIPRRLMPQIYNAKKFSNVIKKRYGIKTRKTTVRAKNLKPSQNEINGDIVDNVIEKIKSKKEHKNPIVISKDKYIVDGHHRWAAYKKFKPNKKIDAVIIDAPVNNAIGVAIATETKREEF